MNNGKTIRQIAEEIGVTKQAVHQKIKKEPLSTSLRKFTSIDGGVVYISVDGEKLIKSAFDKNTVNAVNDSNLQLTSTESASILQFLQRQLEEKDHQLATKDDQIKEKDNQINFLQEAFSKQQLLHGGTIQQQLLGSSPAETSAEHINNNVKSKTKINKQGFFKIFERKK